ncbi:TonB-dependent hemoglobin/transferrin/lactoferrin family receptor [Aliikangiella marina]|nr:TonB-dependent hemoglobin/transferrin/lactoferrin family receptor [Aliikangiella marina]
MKIITHPLSGINRPTNKTAILMKLLLPAALLHPLTSAAQEQDQRLVVTGSRIEQKLEDVIGSVSIITDEQIKKQLASNLKDMFRYDPSITTTGSGADPQTLTVRGIGGNRLVYVKDGRRVNDGYAGGGGFIVGRGYFDTDSIQQVEVAKGAASSLYGSDGLGGIVVISTKDPSDYLSGEDTYIQQDAGYTGTSSQAKLGVTGANRLNNWAVSGVATLRDGSEVQNFDESLPGYSANSAAILLKAENTISSTQTMKLTLDYFGQENSQVIEVGSNETEDKDTSWAVSLDYDSDESTGWYDSWHAQTYFSSYEQASDQVRENALGYVDFNDYRFEQDIVGIRSLFSKSITGAGITHQLVYGIDLDQYDTVRPRLKTRINADSSIAFENQAQRAFPGADTTLAGLFIQDNIDIANSKWSFALGTRLDYYRLEAKSDPLYDDTLMDNIDESAFSPKVAMRYQFNDNLSGYLQYVSGFKIPPHDQAYQSHGVAPFYQILPNADLEPEESDSYEIGFRLRNDNLRLQFNVFSADFDNFIETVLVRTEPTFIPGVEQSFFQFQNLEKATVKGSELVATIYLTDAVNITTSVAYTDGENKATNQPLTSISPLQASLILNYGVREWDFALALRGVDAMTDVPTDDSGNNLVTSSGYGLVDLFAYYNTGSWTVTAGLENALDKEYVPYESIAGQAAGSDLNQFTQPGRTLSAGISYEF